MIKFRNEPFRNKVNKKCKKMKEILHASNSQSKQIQAKKKNLIISTALTNSSCLFIFSLTEIHINSCNVSFMQFYWIFVEKVNSTPQDLWSFSVLCFLFFTEKLKKYAIVTSMLDLLWICFVFIFFYLFIFATATH